MRAGIVVPQGWAGEFQNVTPQEAWKRIGDTARRADALGFDSLWVFDHFHGTVNGTPVVTFEAYTTLAALASMTSRIGLGQLVSCAGYRNPALVAKMVSTLDVVSNGRMTLGLGAGWKSDEWLAYGYDFPVLRDRLSNLKDALEIVTRMFAPGVATYIGPALSVRGAINEPKPLQRPRPKILVGGNGRETTWRLAAMYADELNLDATAPEGVRDAIRIIAERCDEVGRDPVTLPVSVNIWWQTIESTPSVASLLAAYREAGANRVMSLIRDAARSTEALDAFREQCVEAGLDIDPVRQG